MPSSHLLVGFLHIPVLHERLFAALLGLFSLLHPQLHVKRAEGVSRCTWRTVLGLMLWY